MSRQSARRAVVCAVVVVACVAVSSAVSRAAVKDPSAAQCPVSGKGCNPEKSADFAGGKVYFCCGNCEKAFAAEPAQYAARAHHQMVSTGQLVQKGCPFSGGPVKAGTQLDVAGVEVGFCCPSCKGRVEKAAEADRIAMVFGKPEKGFAPAAK